MPKPQSYANHARIDPAFHYFILPLLLINLVVLGGVAAHRKDLLSHWHALVALVLLLLAMQVRIYSLRVQDRVIRLEERTRIAACASPATVARMDQFTIKQLVALRFASDAELPSLAERTLAEQLTPRQIKQAITVWRPDTHRV